MGLRKKLTEKQQTILQAVFDHFNKTGQWPNSVDLNVKLRNLGDLWENAENIGFDYIEAQQHRDSSVTSLTILGISLCKKANDVISLFLNALEYCVKKYIENPQEPKITGLELMTGLSIEHEQLMRLVLLLQTEHRFSAGHNNTADPYSFEMTLSKNILKFENVDTIEDYLEKAYHWTFINDVKNTDITDISGKQNSIWKNSISSDNIDYESFISPLDVLKSLHPDIFDKCQKLFLELHHSEAVEKAFKVVKNRLRDLSGYERASDAFGKGKLHIKGASETHVDHDFNEAVKFLLMSIGFFRNEAFHSLDSRINEPDRAYEYLVLCSLAMNLLDNAKALDDE